MIWKEWQEKVRQIGVKYLYINAQVEFIIGIYGVLNFLMIFAKFLGYLGILMRSIDAF